MEVRRMLRSKMLLAVALATATAALAAVGAAQATGSYGDVTGDGKGAPDIAKVTVTSDAAGQILFTIGVDNLPLGADVTTLLFLNTDMNADTGRPSTEGADYVFGVDDDGYGFARWTGADWDFGTPYSTVRVRVTSGGVTISVNRSELGNTNEFNFWTRTIAGEFSANQIDDAPDEGVWNYSLAANGPNIVELLVQAAPAAGPKAGATFSLTPVGLKLPTAGAPGSLLPAPESYSCKAMLKGRPIVGSGTGGCSWTLPKKARGKALAVVVTVSYQGATKSVPFSYRVR
jgi:hypothetical protein